VVALVSLATTLWLAFRYVAAFMRAANAIYDVPEGRPVWKTLPIRIGVTVRPAVLGLPNARQPFRWITPGRILAVVVWLVASVGARSR
jgi:uncharacterized BrkB/YihY/UPF0761 family membrane protein